MYKQYFKKSNGEVFLFDDKLNEISDEFTDIIPDEGLYAPIHFDGKKWVGTPYEEWLKQQPKVEVEEVPNEKDVLIADLTLQLMETQNIVSNMQNDMASLTLQVLESDINA
ncbi:hypothetical protein FH114_02465 [Staphylococcus hominis]|uniref:hypothetical protein n=1 Tax=Staphylococcus hominis TaxID=1290 RepID=UPI001F585FE4|nr:hypothetical protein [Staphylococcus hominis]MCI2885898.1 hypothetical protein [Staphylococcus hominis]MDS3917522.1 hypothetical protein [Staphylococcus hominis]